MVVCGDGFVGGVVGIGGLAVGVVVGGVHVVVDGKVVVF